MTTIETEQAVWPYCQRCHRRFPSTHRHVREYYERPRTREFWEEQAQALIEDVEWLLDRGESPTEVAKRVGYKNPHSLARRLDRRGRHDLANRFWVLPRVRKRGRGRVVYAAQSQSRALR